jgi:hypothetical protein
MWPSKNILTAFATYLKANPKVKVAIHGHTDSDGSDALNMTLSQNRAKAVNDYLVSKGIAAARLSHQGFGATKPLAPNDHPRGQSQKQTDGVCDYGEVGLGNIRFLGIGRDGYSGKHLRYLSTQTVSPDWEANTHSATTADCFCEAEEQSATTAEHSCVMAEYSCMMEEHSCMMSEHSCMMAEHSGMTEEHSCMMSECSSVMAEHSVMTEEHSCMMEEYSCVVAEQKIEAEIPTTLLEQGNAQSTG